jgi:dienelactone hydrolase
VITDRVDDIPVLVALPEPSVRNGRLTLWMHFLSGSKEAVEPQLARLAESGFVAVSFDAWQHGERTAESQQELLDRCFGGFRREVWPILGHSTLDALRVADWALARYELAPDYVAGGISMGGDLAVALAGIDPRVTRVAPIVATPDWTRPGMTRLDDPTSVIDQGEPTPYGQWLYDHLDPLTHLERYARGPAIAFDLGGGDAHIPAAHARAFRRALGELAPSAGESVVVRVHDGLDHVGVAQDQAVLAASLGWLTL